MFTLTVFEILLLEGRLVLGPAQRGTESERLITKLLEKKTIYLRFLIIYFIYDKVQRFLFQETK